MKKILSSNLLWIAIFFFIPLAACSSNGDDNYVVDAAVDDDDDDSGEQQQPCETQKDCLPAGLELINNCGANNQCYMCENELCETHWLDKVPSADNTATEMFNISWDGELIAGGCKYEMIFYSKVAPDGTTVTCNDILAGNTDITNTLFYIVPQIWSGQCRRSVINSTQVSLIQADTEFLWLANLYDGNDVGELGELVGHSCKELNGPEIDSSGGYSPGYQRDPNSLYKPSIKILPVD